MDLGYLLSIALRGLRMHRHPIGRRCNCQFRFQPFLLRLQLSQLSSKRFRIRMAVHDHVHHVFELTLDHTEITRQVIAAAAPVVIKPLAFVPVCFDRCSHHVRSKQVGVERHHDPLLNVPGLDETLVVAAARIRQSRTAQEILVHDAVAPTTAAAAQQPGQQPLRPPSVIQMRSAAALRALGLHRCPDILVNDPQLRHLLAVPLTFGIVTRDAFTRRRVLEKPLAIVDNHALVKFVIEQTVASLGRTQQC